MAQVPPMATVAPPAPPAAAQTTVAAPKRITMWNKRENRKISGNAAPMEKNIDEYLRKHPECEVYNGQRSQLDPAIRAAQLAAEPRITIWNKSERRKVSGNAAPLEKNIAEYLRKHPDCEVYDGQDKRPAGTPAPQMLSMGPMGIPTQLPTGPMAVPVKPLGTVPKGGLTASPKCTLDFLAYVACQENLNLLHAEDYETDADQSEEETEGKGEAATLPMAKRSLECSAIDQLVKRVKAA